MEKFFITLNSITTYQSLFLCLILFNRKDNRFSNNILSVIMLFSGFKTFILDLFFHNMFFSLHLFTFLLFPVLFMLGPLIYFYTLSMMGKLTTIKKEQLIHFIPAMLVFIIFLIINIYFLSKGGIIELMNLQTYYYKLRYIILSIVTLSPLVVVIYSAISWRVLSPPLSNILDYFSNPAGLHLLWLKNFLSIVFIMFLTNSITSWLYIFQINNTLISNAIILLNFVFTVIVSWFLLRTPDVFKFTHEMLDNLNKTKIKYQKNDIPDRKKDSYQKTLLEYMEGEKPYLEPDITLQALAEKISISPSHLSIILNERLNQNFYSFINSYRISSVIKKIDDPAHSDKTILTLAFESGFNSKSSFNSAFKNYTGKTPTEYKKIHFFHN